MAPVVQNNMACIHALCQAHHVKRLFLFGSAHSGRFTTGSDVDFLYEMDHSLFATQPRLDYATEIFDLQSALENLLKHPVDLVRKDVPVKSPIHQVIGNEFQMVYDG